MKYSCTEIAKAFIARADRVGAKKATKDLGALLLEQHMQGDVEAVLESIAREYARVHNTVEAHVTTAYPLSAELKKELEARVKKETKAQKVIMNETIDRSLLGGVIVTAPDMELDLSLKTKLAKLKV